MTGKTAHQGDYLGSSLLKLAMYWWLVAHFQVWTLGIVAFGVAFLINIIHRLLVKMVDE